MKVPLLAYPITKESNNSHFLFYFFRSSFWQPISVIFFFLCYLLKDLRNKKTVFNVRSLYHKDSTAFRPIMKVKLCPARAVPTRLGDQILVSRNEHKIHEIHDAMIRNRI